MDDLDRKIINILENQGRVSHEELGRQLHISRPAVHQRVNKLEGEKIIKGYKTIVDWSKTGQSIKAFVDIKINAPCFKDVIKQIVNIQIANVAIEECHRIDGEWCIALKVRAGTPMDISNLIDAIYEVSGTCGTKTTFVLSTIMEDGIKDC